MNESYGNDLNKKNYINAFHLLQHWRLGTEQTDDNVWAVPF